MFEMSNCPYCGGIPKIVTTPYDGDYKIKCSYCGLETFWCRTEDEAVITWNNYLPRLRWGRS